MAQSHLIANLDRHEFILPTSLQLGNQLTALAGGYGAMAALTLLIETERMARRWGPPPPGAAPPA
jgi:hypothetical protein